MTSDEPESPSSEGVKTIAFYLPQFHPIPENDEWWGAGFTEWTQVRKARPLFDGHIQPFGPSQSIGFYDLRDVDVIRRQFSLAMANAIDALCIYHYWFSGHRLLDTPAELLLGSDIDGSFCLCWANENWTRRWDGKESEVLIAQRYAKGWVSELFESLQPALSDSRYFKVGGRPLLLIHRADLIPDCAAAMHEIRVLSQREGLGELFLVAAETKPGLDPRPLGFDAACEFPPVGKNNLASALLWPPAGLDRNFRGRLMSYRRIAQAYQRRRDPGFMRFRGTMPGWDNTPRRGLSATVYVESSPELYAAWLRAARASEATRPSGDPRLVFINAWNEWGEGAVLEPSELHGEAFLAATADPDTVRLGRPVSMRGGLPSRAFLRSLGSSTAGSLLSVARRVKFKLAWQFARRART